MSDAEQPLRPVDPPQRQRRPLRVVAVIGVLAACLTALASPWLLVRTPLRQTAADQHAVQQDQPQSAAKLSQPRDDVSDQAYTPDFEGMLPSSPSGAQSDQTADDDASRPRALPDSSGGNKGQVPEREHATLVVAPPLPPVQRPEDDTGAGAGTSAVDAATNRVEDDTPSTDQTAAKPQDAPSATGSLSAPPPPARPDLTSRSAKVTSRVSTMPLPRAFKPSTEREPAGPSRHRQAALPEPARSSAPMRSAGKSASAPARTANAIPATRQAQAPRAKPLSVVLPNSLLPLGSN